MIVAMILPVICIWTGYGLFQLLGPRDLRLNSPSLVFVLGLTGVLALGWVAFTAAEFGLFSAVAIIAAGLLVGGLGWLAARRRGARVHLDNAGTSRVEGFVLLGLILVMGVLYLRPHEFVFGGADAGVYINLGAQMAHSGRWLIHNPDLAAIPLADYAMFFREQPPNQIPHYYYLPGFYIPDTGAQTIIPQFYPLHPVWLAIAHGLGGIWANLYMTPIWGILGVLALYFAVREAFDWRLAALAAWLVALNPTLVWFARYPTAEVLTQFLLFSGLYAFARHIRHGENWSAILAGLAIGQVMLVRIDTYFLLGLLVAYALYQRLWRKLDRRFWFIAAPMLLMSAHSLVQAMWQGQPYLYNAYLAGGLPALTPLILLAVGMAVTVAGLIVIDRLVERHPAWPLWFQPVWRRLQWIAAVGLVLLAIYAYFILPRSADPNRASFYWYAQHTIPDVEPLNFVRLGWYLSPLGLALGALGLAAIVRAEISERTWPLIGVCIFFSILFVYRTFNNPHHVYVMRRYVPAVMPAFALGMAYAVQRVSRWRPGGAILAAGLVIAQVCMMAYGERVMYTQVDYRGGVEQLDHFAQTVPANAIILFDEKTPVGPSATFGTPLAYWKGYTVLGLRGDQLDPVRLDELIRGWLDKERPVVIVETSTRAAQLCARWQCSRLGTALFDLPVLEASYEHQPVSILHQRETLEIYHIKAAQP